MFWRRAFAAAPSASDMTIYSPGFRLGWRRTGTSSALFASLRPAPRLRGAPRCSGSDTAALIQLPSARHALALREWCAHAANDSERPVHLHAGRVSMRNPIAPAAKLNTRTISEILSLRATPRRAEDHYPTPAARAPFRRARAPSFPTPQIVVIGAALPAAEATRRRGGLRGEPPYPR